MRTALRRGAAIPALRVFLGDQLLPLPRAEYVRRIAEWEAWDDLSRSALG